MPTFKEFKLILLEPEMTFYDIWSHGIFFHWKTLPQLNESEVLWGNVGFGGALAGYEICWDISSSSATSPI